MKRAFQRLATGLVVAVAITFASNPANAVTFITGDFTFTGVGDYAGAAGAGAATALDFGSNDAGTSVGTAGSFTVATATGDFSALVGATGSISDFSSVGAISTVAIPVSYTPFLTVGGFTFDANSIVVSFRNATTIVLDGFGTLSAVGFADTPGTFSLSTIGSGGSFTFTYASAVAAVPEPHTWVMFIVGFGLLGFALRRRTPAFGAA